MKKVIARIYTGLQYSMVDVECDTIEEAMELQKKYHHCLKDSLHLTPVAPKEGTKFVMGDDANKVEWRYEGGKWKFQEKQT